MAARSCQSTANPLIKLEPFYMIILVLLDTWVQMHNTILNYIWILGYYITSKKVFKNLIGIFLEIVSCNFLLLPLVLFNFWRCAYTFLTVYDKDFTSLLKAHGWQSEGKTVTVAFPFQRGDSGWLFEKIKYVIIFLLWIYMFCLLLKINTLQIK